MSVDKIADYALIGDVFLLLNGCGRVYNTPFAVGTLNDDGNVALKTGGFECIEANFFPVGGV